MLRKNFHDAKLNNDVEHGYHAISIDEKRKDFPPCLWEEDNIHHGQIIEQVWFAGVHADVGGWYDERGLANISLHWMLQKALGCGMLLDEVALKQYIEDPYDIQHEEYKGFWKFRGSHVRIIPDGSSIHISVKKRLDKGDYKPDNFPNNPTYVG